MAKQIALLVLIFVSAALAQQPAAVSPDSAQKTSNQIPAAAANVTEPVVVSKVDPVYPVEARSVGIQGTVVIEFTVAEDGSVKDAVAADADKRLAEAALNAVREWKYKPATRDGKPIAVKRKVTLTFQFKPLWKRPDPVPSPDGTTMRIRVSQGVEEGLLKHKETPQYPKIARDAHIQGSVILHALIDYDGRVFSLGLVSGPKELVDSAVESVKNWQYQPYLLNGKPVQVDTLITIKYFLAGY